MYRILSAFAVAALIAVPAAMAQAQDRPATTLDQVLRLVKDKTALETAAERKRIQEFQANKNEQQQLLSKARAQRTQLQQRSEQLDQQFDNNEIRITQLEELLNERQGNLKELFGVVKQASGELAGSISDSFTSAQFDDRTEFLEKLAQKREVELPTIEELQKLWALYLQEINETGKVAKFSADVLADGGIEERQVVRVGNFGLVSDGDYLRYNSEIDQIEEFEAQPAGAFTSSASDLVDATEGPVDFGVDPSRGQILGTLVRVPSIVDRFHQGGLVGYVIAILGVIGVALAVWRWIALTLTGGKVNAQMKRETASTDNPLGRVMAVYEENRAVDVETLELKLDEAILKEVPNIEMALGIIKVISVVAPLLGLLGTVTGMILTFQAITLFGAGDPQIMAGGISQALVTTVLGLVVAIPMTLLYTLVASRARRIVHVLEEQSAGIIAVHAEKRTGSGA